MSRLGLLHRMSKYDNVYTPKYALFEIVKYLPKDSIIWECANSNSKHENQITKFLKSKGFKVVETSIYEGFDFEVYEPDFEFDVILTNPPYSLKDGFLKRCYYHGKPFALLLPATALGDQKRVKMYQEHGIQILVPHARIDFTGKGSPHFHASWFCWKLLPEQLIFYDLKEEEEETVHNLSYTQSTKDECLEGLDE